MENKKANLKFPSFSMNGKRGISPVIATVLLIAIVLVLAIIIFVWMRGFIGEEITKFGNPIKEACGDVDLLVDSDASGAININNRGSVGVLSIKLKVEDGDDEVLLNCEPISLAPARAVIVPSGDCGSVSGDLISVIPILQGVGENNEPKTYECSDEEFFFP